MMRCLQLVVLFAVVLGAVATARHNNAALTPSTDPTPVPTPGSLSLTDSEKVAKTISNLAEVFERMHQQIDADEKVFKAFKNQVLENEVKKADVSLSWPAIKDLVQNEVDVGRRNVNNQVSKFKLDVLNLVQKGLDALRADVRATVSTEFMLKNVKTNSSVSLDADEPEVSAPASLETFLDNANVSKTTKEEIKEFVKEKMTAEDKTERVDDYGQSAAAAIKDIEYTLRGKLSMKDLKSELFSRLQKLSKEYLRNPTPAAKIALRELEEAIVKGLDEIKLKRRQAREQEDLPSESLDEDELHAQHSDPVDNVLGDEHVAARQDIIVTPNKPAEAKPAEAKPAEAKPAEAKPAAQPTKDEAKEKDAAAKAKETAADAEDAKKVAEADAKVAAAKKAQGSSFAEVSARTAHTSQLAKLQDEIQQLMARHRNLVNSAEWS